MVTIMMESPSGLIDMAMGDFLMLGIGILFLGSGQCCQRKGFDDAFDMRRRISVTCRDAHWSSAHQGSNISILMLLSQCLAKLILDKSIPDKTFYPFLTRFSDTDIRQTPHPLILHTRTLPAGRVRASEHGER
ncbi:MAG: hypothetical protein IJ302_04270 [Clostridia bacterium]|nr:hypothetical protein [Clostridia bacterium]